MHFWERQMSANSSGTRSKSKVLEERLCEKGVFTDKRINRLGSPSHPSVFFLMAPPSFPWLLHHCLLWPPAHSIPHLSFMFFYVLLSLSHTLLRAWSSCKASRSRVSLFHLCASVAPSEDSPLEPLSHCNVIISVHTYCPHLLVSSKRTALYPQCFTFSLRGSKWLCTLP